MILGAKKVYFYFLIIFFIFFLSISYAKYNIPISNLKILHTANIFIQKKNYEKAITLLEKYIQNNKDVNYILYFYLGNCYFLSKKIDKAIIQYKKCIKLKEDFSDVWVNMANCYFEKKDYLNAGKAFLNANKYCLEKDKTCLEYLYNASICFYYAKKFKLAENIIKKLVDNKNICLKYIDLFAHILISQAKYKKALKYVVLLSDSKKAKNRESWQEIRLEIYIRLNMKKQAINYLQFLLNEDPLNTKWWIGLAHFYLKDNKYKQALVALIIKGLICPYTPEEQKIVASLYMSLDIPREAVKFYEALWNKKKNFSLAKILSQAFYRMYDYNNCFLWLNRALSLKKDKELLLLKAQVLFFQKKYILAYNAFLVSARLMKNTGRPYIMAAYAAYEAGDIQKARKAVLFALKYKDVKKQAQNFLNAIKHN